MKKVRNFLIPHDENGHVPHIFSEKVMAGLLAFVVIIYGTSLISTLTLRMKDQMGAVYASVLIDMTNKARAETALPMLAMNETLTEAANRKALDMVNNSYFAHTSPNGITPWDWFRDVNYNFAYAGENLAVGFNESEQVHTGWLNSPTHKANIMSANFSEIGIAVADGIHKGRPAIFVVQMFGKPKAQRTPIVPAVVQEEPSVAVEDTNTNQGANVLSALAEEVPVLLKEAPAQIITTVFEDKYLAIARDDTPEVILYEAVENDISTQGSLNTEFTPQSSTSDRILVSQPVLVQYIFTIIMLLTLFSLIAFLVIEFKAKHMRHAIYGVILLAVTAGLSFSNHAMIVFPKLFY